MHAIDREKQQLRRSVVSAGSFGLELAAYVGLGFQGGPWLDHRLDTAPVFKYLGYVIGIGAPINAFVRIIRDYNRDLKQDLKQDLENDESRDDQPK